MLSQKPFQFKGMWFGGSIACNNVIKQRNPYLVVKEKNLSTLPEAGEIGLGDLVVGHRRAI